MTQNMDLRAQSRRATSDSMACHPIARSTHAILPRMGNRSNHLPSESTCPASQGPDSLHNPNRELLGYAYPGNLKDCALGMTNCLLKADVKPLWRDVRSPEARRCKRRAPLSSSCASGSDICGHQARGLAFSYRVGHARSRR